MWTKNRRQRVRAWALALPAFVFMLPSLAEGGISYRYDRSGRLTAVLYDNGLCIVYTYDASGNRLSQVTSSAQASPPIWGSATWGCFQWTP